MEEKVVTRKYPSRYEHIYLIETESPEFKHGEFFLYSVFETGLNYDLILCSKGGSANVRQLMPTVSFIEETNESN